MNILKKIIAAGTIFGMIAGASPAFAATAEEILAQIQRLQAQLNQLMSQYQQMTGQTTQTPAACVGITFTQDLAQGMSGNEVKCLQALLGVTPQTGFFGPLTFEAVKKFQEQNAAQILTPLGLTAGTGYVGARTRAVLNGMLTPVTPPPTATPTPTPTPSPQAGLEGVLSATLEAIPANVTVYPGEQNKSVAAYKVVALGSPIKLDRVDLVFNVKPYKCFSYVSLFDGANAIKGVAPVKDIILETGGLYYLRLTGLDYTVPAGAAGKVLTVKVSSVSVYPSDCSGQTINLTLPANGIRGVDTAALQQYAPIASLTRNFSLSSAATSGNLVSSLSADTPKEGLAIISSTAGVTTEVELLKFNAKWENLGGKLKTATVQVSTSAANLNKVQALNLYDGTTLIGTVSVPSSTTSTTLTFSDLNLAMAKDASKPFTVKAVVEHDFTVNTYLMATLTSISGEDENEVTDSDATSRTGNKIYIYTKAPVLSGITVKAEAKDMNATSGAETIVGEITFKVTATGGDIWISTSTTDLDALAVKSDNSTSSLGAIVITTSAVAEAWGYKVPEGQQITFTVNAVASPASVGFWRIVIRKLTWNTINGAAGAASWTGTWAIGDLRTGPVYLTAN